MQKHFTTENNSFSEYIRYKLKGNVRAITMAQELRVLADLPAGNWVPGWLQFPRIKVSLLTSKDTTHVVQSYTQTKHSYTEGKNKQILTRKCHQQQSISYICWKKTPRYTSVNLVPMVSRRQKTHHTMGHTCNSSISFKWRQLSSKPDYTTEQDPLSKTGVNAYMSVHIHVYCVHRHICIQ